MKPSQEFPINDHRVPGSFSEAHPLSHTSSLNTSVEKRRDRSTRRKEAVIKLSAVEEVSPVKVEAARNSGLIVQESATIKGISTTAEMSKSPQTLFLENKSHQATKDQGFHVVG